MDCVPWDDEDVKHSPDCYADMQAVLARALERSLRQVPNRNAIRAWHRTAFGRVVPVPYYAGNYRQADGRRLCLGQDVAVGLLAGAPYRQVLSLMLGLQTFLNTELSSLEIVWNTLSAEDRARRLAIVIGTTIGQFVHIHPFLNGNGRLSRVLWRVLLFRMGFRNPGFSVMRRPGGSYSDVMEMAMRGQYSHAVAMVLRGIARGPMPSVLPDEETVGDGSAALP